MIPVGNIGGLLERLWNSVKQGRLKKLAWNLRDYADSEKRKEPNLYAFSRAALTRQLGQSSHRIREVLEFMEEKGWAVKVRFPVHYWQIN